MTKLMWTLVIGAAWVAPRAAAQDPSLGSTSISWDEIQARPTGSNGMSKAVLRSRTATLDELEMHVTALPAGKTTHPPHTHPNEEIIIIREGTLDAYQNGKTTRLGPGSIIFEASNEPHNVTNVGKTTAVYHVINWASPGMLEQKAAAATQDAIRAFYLGWSQASRERGAKGYAASFAEDAVLLPPDAAPLLGRAAIQDWQERAESRTAHRTLPGGISEDELQLLGDRAIYRSTFKATRVPKADGDGEPVATRYFDVLRQKPDGGWEFTHRMWSSAQ